MFLSIACFGQSLYPTGSKYFYGRLFPHEPPAIYHHGNRTPVLQGPRPKGIGPSAETEAESGLGEPGIHGLEDLVVMNGER